MPLCRLVEGEEEEVVLRLLPLMQGVTLKRQRRSLRRSLRRKSQTRIWASVCSINMLVI